MPQGGQVSTRVALFEDGWEVTCSGCQWLYWTLSLVAAKREAARHKCKASEGTAA